MAVVTYIHTEGSDSATTIELYLTVLKSDLTTRQTRTIMIEDIANEVPGVFYLEVAAIEPNDKLVIDDGTANIAQGFWDDLMRGTDNSLTLSTTGFTVGGTMTISKLFKLLASWIAGKWAQKEGSETIDEVFDADDGVTPTMEVTAKAETPYREVDIQ